MSTFKKAISLIVALILAVSICTIPAFADNATISCDKNVYVGDTFQVTVTCYCDSSSGIGAIDGLFTYDTTVFECVSYSANTSFNASKKGYVISYATPDPAKVIKNTSFTFKLKALKEGTGGIYIQSDITSFDETTTLTKTNQVRVNITDKTKLSNNANLKALRVSSGKIVPDFNPKITNYTVQVPYSVTTVYMVATTEEAKANIEVQGSSKVNVGNNKRTIVVTAPNGLKKTYILNIYRAKDGEDVSSNITSADTQSTESLPEDYNPYEIMVEDKLRYIAADFSGVVLPNGFTQTVIKMNNTNVPGLVDPVNNKTLVYATDKEGNNGAFYAYDREKNLFTLYKYFNTKASRYVILDYDGSANAPEGYYYTTSNVQGFNCGCFKYSDHNYSSFTIVYCEAADGTKDFYRYDSTDGSMQRAKEFSMLMKNSDNQKIENRNIFQKFAALELKGKIVIIAVLCVLLLLIVLVIVMIVRNAKAKKLNQPLVAEEPSFMDIPDDSRELYLGDFDADEIPNNETDNK